MANEVEVKMIADFVRKMTGMPGVCVLVLADDSCPFGYAFAAEHEATLRAALPAKLREVASLVERERPPDPAS